MNDEKIEDIVPDEKIEDIVPEKKTEDTVPEKKIEDIVPEEVAAQVAPLVTTNVVQPTNSCRQRLAVSVTESADRPFHPRDMERHLYAMFRNIGHPPIMCVYHSPEWDQENVEEWAKIGRKVHVCEVILFRDHHASREPLKEALFAGPVKDPRSFVIDIKRCDM